MLLWSKKIITFYAGWNDSLYSSIRINWALLEGDNLIVKAIYFINVSNTFSNVNQAA